LGASREEISALLHECHIAAESGVQREPTMRDGGFDRKKRRDRSIDGYT
jgi:hypothetical protein